MKKALVCIAVLAACLAVVPMAAARHHDKQSGDASTFFVAGTVTAVDSTASTVTIQLGHGRHWGHGGHWGHKSRGVDVTITVTATTQISACGADPSVPLTLADVKVGDLAAAKGSVDRTDPAAPVYTADQLRVKHIVPRFELAGAVKAVDTTAGTVTVTVKQCSRHARGTVGTDVVITVDADTQIVACGKDAKPLTLADIQVGDKVAANGTVDKTDPANPVYLAKKMLVKHPVVRFVAAGSVSAVDATAGTLTVAVTWGTGDLAGTDLVVLVTADTRFCSFSGQRPTKVSFGDVQVGDKVMVRGIVATTDPAAPVYTACGVAVWPAPVPAAGLR